MHTAFDWTAMALFCGLALLFLQRSIGQAVAGDAAVKYLPAALGCAVADQIGNAGWTITAALLLLAVTGYMLVVLKPWTNGA